jgi:hypothetical protein
MTQTAAEKIDQLECAFEAYGYFVAASAIVGEEDLWAKTLFDGFTKMYECHRSLNRRYGYRGLSVNSLNALHSELPEPCFGVEIKS